LWSLVVVEEEELQLEIQAEELAVLVDSELELDYL
jgi:hypothetical protein